MKSKLTTYREGQQIPAHSFFILNKGLNTGRPSLSPNPNCFMLHAENEDEHNRFYWISYALWGTGKFKQYLIGSVIPFIHINDMWQLLELANCAAINQGDQFQQAVSLLYDLQGLSKKAVIRIRDIQIAKLKVLQVLAAV